MKKLVVLLLAIVLLFSCAACGGEKPPKKNPFDEYQYTWAEDGVLKILAIGNSWTENTIKYVPKVLECLGIENFVVESLTVGNTAIEQHQRFIETGASIYTHGVYENGNWTQKSGTKGGPVIQSNDWDYISFNQLSSLSGIPESVDQLANILAYIKPMVSETTKFVYNMTWAYAKTFKDVKFEAYNYDQETMFWSVLSTVDNAVKPLEDIFLITPCGTAIQNARTSYLGDHFTSDGIHLNFNGEYIVALTYASMLTGMSIEHLEGLPTALELNEKLKAMMIEAAMNAIEKPFAITPSSFVD